MQTLLILVFILAYAAIALEHQLKVNKSAPALIGAGLLWILFATASGGDVSADLDHSLSAVAQVVFFLMGAMTIVEVVDAHDGFEVITQRIRTRSMVRLFWLIGLVTFFLSAVLDNLTTTIVMLSVCRKLLPERQQRLFAAGIIIIAANAGGAWSPIGDVTTTMLWIGGQITALKIIEGVFLPALINLLVPLAVISYQYRGKQISAAGAGPDNGRAPGSAFERNFMLFAGLGLLCSVPLFKALTGLPPFMGILFALGLLWLAGELIHAGKPEPDRRHLTLAAALQRIDMASLVFFIGILLAVATLEHSHVLSALAHYLDRAIGDLGVIVFVFGLASAVIDNVPLVAAAMGMYSLAQYPADSFLWEFMAYAAGTGGSVLIIGSAAGVAAMGIEKIEFFWYVRKISLLALLGYVAGAAAYVLLR
jgi:Na+/H+ antiporter NhaD/arsenite permease-like protein